MKKKIAFISEHASPLATLGGVDAGGQNVYVAELARQLIKNGYDVDVFTRWEDASLEQVVDYVPGVRVVHIQAGPVQYVHKEELLPFMAEFREHMIDYMMEEDIRYDLVHANFWMSALVASEIKQILGIPYVITFHALGHVRRIYQKEADKFPPERLQIEEETARLADQVIAECPQDKEDLIHYYGVDPARIAIIPCGFNPSEFYPVNRSFARSLLGLNQKEHILLQLGRMVPRKGVDNVIKALAYLKNFRTPLRLIVVGGESDHPDPLCCPEIARLQKLAEAEGVHMSVTFAGRKGRDMLKYYYSAADVFITTPWYEPFGITPLESMACGTPVIGAKVGGIKFSVKDGQTGFLVPPNDPEALADKIEYMLSDSLLIRKMKTNAIQRVHTLFTWAKIADAVATMYEAVTVEVNKEMTPAKTTKKKLAPVISISETNAKTQNLGNLGIQ